MKKIIITMLFLFFIIIVVNSRCVSAETYTTFEEINFTNDSNVKLIDSWSNLTLKGHLSKLDKKCFGWSKYYNLKKEPFEYVAETLYHVKNTGFSEITHTFKYEESSEETVQKTATGTLSIDTTINKENKKTSKFKFGLEGELEYEYKNTTKTKQAETDTVKIIISPSSELFIKVRGKGYLYQGVARKYFFFIKTKEGAFEFAVITTEYYSIDMTSLITSSNEE